PRRTVPPAALVRAQQQRPERVAPARGIVGVDAARECGFLLLDQGLPGRFHRGGRRRCRRRRGRGLRGGRPDRQEKTAGRDGKRSQSVNPFSAFFLSASAFAAAPAGGAVAAGFLPAASGFSSAV